MSSYCTVEDVERQTQLTFTLAGRPTRNEVDEMIVNTSSKLNGVAQAAGYEVPVVGAAALELMEDACIDGVSCRVWHSAYVSQDAPARVEYWCQEYKDFLAALKAQEVELPGLVSESDLDPMFAIVQQPPRDPFWTGRDEPLE